MLGQPSHLLKQKKEKAHRRERVARLLGLGFVGCLEILSIGSKPRT